MVKKKKESSEQALERVYNKHVSIPEGLDFSSYKDKVKEQLPDGLKKLFNKDVAEEHFKYYSGFTKEMKKIKGEPLAKIKAQERKQELKSKVKERLILRQKLRASGLVARKVIHGTPVKVKQLSRTKKQYDRSYQLWTPVQQKFIRDRVSTRSTKQITKEFNLRFNTNRSISSIGTKKVRLRKK